MNIGLYSTPQLGWVGVSLSNVTNFTDFSNLSSDFQKKWKKCKISSYCVPSIYGRDPEGEYGGDHPVEVVRLQVYKASYTTLCEEIKLFSFFLTC